MFGNVGLFHSCHELCLHLPCWCSAPWGCPAGSLLAETLPPPVLLAGAAAPGASNHSALFPTCHGPACVQHCSTRWAQQPPRLHSEKSCALGAKEGLFQEEDCCEMDHVLTSLLSIPPITDATAGVAQPLALSEISTREREHFRLVLRARCEAAAQEFAA